MPVCQLRSSGTILRTTSPAIASGVPAKRIDELVERVAPLLERLRKFFDDKI